MFPRSFSPDRFNFDPRVFMRTKNLFFPVVEQSPELSVTTASYVYVE